MFECTYLNNITLFLDKLVINKLLKSSEKNRKITCFILSSPYKCMQINFLFLFLYIILCIVVFLSIFWDLSCSAYIFSGLLPFFLFLRSDRHKIIVVHLLYMLHMILSTEDICGKKAKLIMNVISSLVRVEKMICFLYFCQRGLTSIM